MQRPTRNQRGHLEKATASFWPTVAPAVGRAQECGTEAPAHLSDTPTMSYHDRAPVLRELGYTVQAPDPVPQPKSVALRNW